MVETRLERLANASPFWPMLVVAVSAFILFLPGFFTLPPIDRDETRFSQASRQMVETGDFVDIRLGEGTRYKKPVGIYWLQSAALAVAGPEFANSIWVYRIPSLIAATAACLLTYLIALSLMSAPVAFIAALLMAVSFVLGGEARLAKTDATLLVTILAAQWVLARLHMGRDLNGVWPWLFWVALGASVLVKGPIGPMVVGLTALVLSGLRRDVRWLSALRPGWGFAVFCAMVLPWFVAITIISDGGFWTASLGRDLIAKIGEGQESHGAPFGSFTVAVWLTFGPASLLLPFGLWFAWVNRREPAVQFCLAWILPSWLVFEIAATKLIHYVLPTYPALAMLSAAGWLARRDGPISLGYRAFLVVFLAVALVLAAVPVGFTLDQGQGPSLVWISGVVVSIVGIWWVWTRMRAGDRFSPLLGFGALAFGLSTSLFGHLARFDYMWPSNRMAEVYQSTELCDQPQLVALGYHETSLMLLTDVRPVFTSNPQEAADLVGAAACAMVIADERRRDAFVAALDDRPHDVVERFEGLSIGGYDRLDITVFAFR